MKRFSLISVAGKEQAYRVMDVALGHRPADMVITNATLMNVYTGEFQEHVTVGITGEWIAYVGEEPEPSIGSSTDLEPTPPNTIVRSG